MHPEIWKNTEHSNYMVSNFGHVKSLERRVKHSSGGTQIVRGRILKEGLCSSGYLQVVLCQNGNKVAKRIHRLVLETFAGPCLDNMQGCHNDGDRTNNHINNLRWDTPKNNHADRIKHGTSSCGEGNSSSILKDCDIYEIFRLKSQKASQADIAKKFGVNRATISLICTGKTWTHIKNPFKH